MRLPVGYRLGVSAGCASGARRWCVCVCVSGALVGVSLWVVPLEGRRWVVSLGCAGEVCVGACFSKGCRWGVSGGHVWGRWDVYL